MKTARIVACFLLLAGAPIASARAADRRDFDAISDVAFGELTVEAARAYGNAHYDEAFGKFQRLACAGDKASQAMVGRMYLAGEGVPRDDLSAYLWLKLASEFTFAGYRTTVQRIESVLQPEVLKVWKAQADSLRERYGLRATNMSCNLHTSQTFSSTVKDTVICTPKREGGVVLLHRCTDDQSLGRSEAATGNGH